MADLSAQLAAALGMSYQKPDFSQQDYYAPYANIANQLGQSAILAGNQYGTGEKVAAGLISGLLGGAMQNLSDDYQVRARDAYQNQVLSSITGQLANSDNEDVLGSKLFAIANDSGDLFKVAANQEAINLGLDVAKDNRALDRAILSEISKNPNQRERILASLPENLQKRLGYTPRGEETPLFKPAKKTTSQEYGPELGVENLDDMYQRLFDREIEKGVPDQQASVYARETVEDYRKRAKDLVGTKLADNADAIGQFEDIIRKGEEGILKAGNTGSKVASAYEKAVSTLIPWSTPEADTQVQGDSLLAQTKQLGAAINRIKGSGALSDFESRALFETAMGSDKPKAANEQILQSYKNGLTVLKEHQNFMNYFMDKTGGNPETAQTLWELYKAENPILAQNESGSYVVNPNRQPWQTYNFEDSYKRFLSGETTGGSPNVSTAPTPPAGYELTGKVDANGKYGIRKIQ